jgi:DNA helicase II / ATP-dependent DNA helicase PcrA
VNQYEQSYNNLNQAQKEAVDNTEGPVLVIAGPGTGKTQLLTTRVAHILNTTDSLPENILCLTFSDAASLTMRQRLIQMIGQPAYGVTINTFHAFGNELLQSYPDYFSASSELIPTDELFTDSLLRRIITGLTYDNPLKYADNYIPDIRSFISDAKRALLSPDELRKIITDNQKFTISSSQAVNEALRSMHRVDAKSVGLFENLRAQFTTDRQDELPGGVIPLVNLFKESLSAGIAEVQLSGKSSALTKWKNSWLVKDETGNFIVDGERICNRLLAATDIYETYAKSLTESGRYDYDDMVLSAVSVLEHESALRYTLQEKYLYIMVDEFQDTNRLQLRLTELLTNNLVSEGRPNIMVVGDDDQAIYAFQGAHYSHMQTFYQLYKDVRVITLSENYRSTPDILYLAGNIANQINNRLDKIGSVTAHSPLHSATANTSLSPVVERVDAVSDIEQYSYVTHKIHGLIRSGVDPNQIVVLAPQHKYLESLVSFLHADNIPVRYEKRENILDSSIIKELVEMSKLVIALQQSDHSLVNSLWPIVLGFEFWGITTQQLWELSWQASDTNTPWVELMMVDPSFKIIALYFIRLSQLCVSCPLETMLDYLIGSEVLDLNEPTVGDYSCPMYEKYFGQQQLHGATTSFWDMLSDLIIIRARLREYRSEDSSSLNLEDFIGFISDHLSSGIKILNTNPHQEAEHSINLMTAYKAKGQEFEVVFVLSCNDEVWGTRAKGARSHLSLPANLSFIHFDTSTDDERLRLLYVAITRAKRRLYLVSYSHDYGGKPTTPLKYLSESVGDTAEAISPLLPVSSQKIKATQAKLISPTTEMSAYWHQQHFAALKSPTLAQLLLVRLQLFQLSPTHITQFIDVMHAGPETFLFHVLLKFPVAPHPRAEYGSAIHECLLWIHNYYAAHSKLPAVKLCLETFDKMLMRKRLPSGEYALLRVRGHICLSAYLSQRGSTISKNNVCEFNFRNQGVFIGDAHMSGKIDKLVIDPVNKTIVIVDYKTGPAHVRWVRDVSLHRYKLQLYCYKLLVEGSRRFKGYRVTGSYLEFVEPDEAGNISELHLDFQDPELNRTKELIARIWKSIMSLELPDTSGYSMDVKGIEQFEADLLR